MLGEIVPHNLSAELTEGAGGPQIVVQGADHEGSEFKITLAQQLLLAQHLLNQVQTQRLGRAGTGTGDGDGTDQPHITTGRCWRGGEGWLSRPGKPWNLKVGHGKSLKIMFMEKNH